MKVLCGFSSGVAATLCLFDIVTVEGEGCAAAGWEEMSEGERRTDGVSEDDGAFAGFPRFVRAALK